MYSKVKKYLEGGKKLGKFWKNQRLLFKLIAIVLASVLITLLVLYFLLTQRMMRSTQENEGDFLLQLGSHIASQESVIEAVELEETNPALVEYTDNLGEAFNLDYAVVMTEDSVRLTHPAHELIYETFQGDDQYEVFTGETYTSIGEGTLGPSLRSFVPIYNGSQEVIGAVSLGITTQTLEEIARSNTEPLTIAFAVSAILGITLATLAAYSLKKQMLDMEPQEIARVLEERNAMMEYATDAMFVTNTDREILLANKEAKKQFAVNEDQNSPQIISNLLPFLEKTDKEARGDVIYSYNHKDYLTSYAPVIVNEKVVGYLYTLRDATELYMLTNQLYSASEYAHTLEAQQHDFLNKLHVIYGLTDLEEYGELKKYLEDLIEPEREFSKRVAHLVHNPVLAGFLIGERRKFSENQLPFTIEIYPDIPEADNFYYTRPWMEKVGAFNKILLEADQITEIHMSLSYFDEKLITKYKIQGNIDPVYEQLKNTENSDVVDEKGSKWLALYFVFPYESLKENQPYSKK